MWFTLEKAKRVARRGRKATGLYEIAGLPEKVARFFVNEAALTRQIGFGDHWPTNRFFLRENLLKE